MAESRDFIIIGGGAAGLVAAITAKQIKPDLDVLILERCDRVAKKLLLTGNGRCNITNQNISPSRYHGANPAFADFCLSQFGEGQTKEFFKSIGVEVIADSTGREYPASLQASSVVDALRFAAEEAGIDIQTNRTVTGLKSQHSGFIISGEDFSFKAKSVLLSTGGLAGGSRLGCDETGYRLAKSCGHKLISTAPAITQIKTDTSFIRKFKGIKVDAKLSIEKNNKIIGTDSGEILFCDYGISGPPAFQLSRLVNGNTPCHAVIDFLPATPYAELVCLLKERRSYLAKRQAEEFLTGYINKRIGQSFIRLCNLHAGQICSEISDSNIEYLAKNLKAFRLEITGNIGFSAAQVTSGGVATNQINPNTMMSQIVPGLFFAGETVDINGDCGGFNLQWAWASAAVAAKNAILFLEGGS